MDPERWRQIERLYHAVLDRDSNERDSYLRDACRDDPDLRREVEELLKQGSADSFLETPLMHMMARQEAVLASEARFHLAAGTRLGPYEIRQPLGAGGMGEVYRARDTRLSRDVAVKILPAEVANDPSRCRRFEIEARAVAALNHPNIVALYDVGEGYLVSELVDGKPLQAVKLALPKLLNVAIQIANGLAAAHAAGITHRDLKPGNILLTRDGRAKILDFGLAKMTQPRAGAPGTETITAQTEPGVVMGTLAYMSPEQVRNQEVDGRSDIFSLGVILHEMLSGARPFRGETSTDIMHAILREDPPELPPSAPPAVKQIVAHCLEKDPANRFQSAKDLAFALEASAASGAHPAAAPKRPARPKWAIPAAALALAAAALLYWLIQPLPPPRVTGIVQITHDGLTKYDFEPLVSDGLRVFFSSDYEMPKQVSAKGGESVPLVLQAKAYVIDITPDRSELLLCRGVPGGCELWTQPVLGGSASRLGNIVTTDAAWSPNGRQLLYAQGPALYLASKNGTDGRKLAAFNSVPISPCWSPDGRRIRFTLSAGGGNPDRLWELQADGAHLHSVLPGWSPTQSIHYPHWTPDGKYFVFEADRKLWAVREKGRLLQPGASQPIELNIGLLAASNPLPSPDGKRLFFVGQQARYEFLRYDLKLGRFSLEFPGLSATGLEFSRDGKWIAYVSVPEGLLFRSAVDGSQRFQLTSPPMEGVSLPRWSPDGKQIAFMAHVPPEKLARVYIVSFEGGAPRQVSHGEGGQYGDVDPTWSPDGALLAFAGSGDDKPEKESIRVLDLKTLRVSTLPGSAGMWSPRWSPDGHFIAGFSVGENNPVLYDIRTRKQTEFPSRLSAYPCWSRDGESLYFVDNEPSWRRLRMRDRKIELVTPLKNISLVDYGWYTIAPDNSLITAHNVGTDEIYALDLDLP